LIAQEVKEILPEIVRVGDDPEKTMGIIYTELIPVLIQGMKEQQAMITELQTKLELYKNEKTATVKDSETNKILDGVVLYQNSPNPFDRSTEIRYYIPERIETANIIIFDLNGKQLKNFTIDTRGDGGITLESGAWIPGMYLYSLTVDGVIADTKRMILSGN
ncbi:MAG: T9SS type A sorting domain-containing protein, partial [Taibaiella sp.]|nr:T9SS type A sorting domain-containing protein [Taibaiella sp.]